MDGFHINLGELLLTLTALVLGITVHEFSHAFVADRLGDDTPRSQGRVTLWPLAHLDPIGSLLMLISSITGYGIGWGRPVLTDPRNYRINRRLGSYLVSIAGPLSNLILAVLFGMILRFGLLHDEFYRFWVREIVIVNLLLCFFNLLPIYPLDGSKLVAYALPPEWGDPFLRFSQQIGPFVLMALVFSSLTGYILGPPLRFFYQLIAGGG